MGLRWIGGSDDSGNDAKHVAATVSLFITIMDGLSLDMKAVDEVCRCDIDWCLPASFHVDLSKYERSHEQSEQAQQAAAGLRGQG